MKRVLMEQGSTLFILLQYKSLELMRRKIKYFIGLIGVKNQGWWETRRKS